MNVVIIGAGSIGMLYGGKLAQTGKYRPIIVTHSEEQSRSLLCDGMKIIDQTSATVYDAVMTTNHLVAVSYAEARDQMKWREWIMGADWIFLMVKQQQMSDSFIEWLGQLMNMDGCRAAMVCFQNGVGHIEKLSQHISIDRLYVAVITEGAHRTGIDTITHKGKGRTIFGPVLSSGSKELDNFAKNNVNKLKNALNEAGFNVLVSNQMDRYIWNKLLINSMINPLTAMYQIKNGQLLQSPYLLNIMKQLLAEGLEVAKIMKVETSPDLWQQTLQVCELTANNTSSMLQDITQGRQTEIEWINGSLIRIALHFELALPYHEAVFNRVKAMEERPMH